MSVTQISHKLFYKTILNFYAEESEIEKTKSNLSIDLSKDGLSLCFKDYQELLLRGLWETNTGQSSRDAWIKVNEELKKKGSRESISRASVINFLNAMVDEKLLSYTEITGKGGHRRIYTAAMTEQEFWKYVTELMRIKLKTASMSSLIFP